MIRTTYKCMKIVVSIISSEKGSKHLVQVLDHNSLVYSEITDTVGSRDLLVWQLADTYNVLDIEVQHNKDQHNTDDFQFTGIPSIPVLDEQDADAFFEDHEELVYTRILKAIEEGIIMNLETIRLFELSGTGVYLTAERCDWDSGLKKAIEYFITTEDYDKCIIGKQLLTEL